MQSETALRQEIESLRASIEQLYALNELARMVGASDDVESTIQVLTRRSIALIKAEQGGNYFTGYCGGCGFQNTVSYPHDRDG